MTAPVDVNALAVTLGTVSVQATIRPRSLDATISVDAVDATLPDQTARAATAELQPFAQRLAVGATLGEGGMAVVRIATQRSLGREVAVKMMRGDATEEASPRMLREAWITGALEHPNIVPVHDLGTDEHGRPMLVLKRIEGRPWSELMAARRLEANLETLLDVCNAIAFAHSKGIIHRDLKPQNVMIGGFGEVYVLDWGIAVSLVDDGTGRLPLASDCTEIAGTLAYMAPEMLGNMALTERTDVYLLGAILFEIATGKPPHQGASMRATIASIQTSEPSLDESVADELAAICKRALAKSAADRYASVDELRSAIRGFVEHRGSSALAEEAHDQLRVLEQHFAAPREDAAAHRTRTYQLFGEVRFGFQAALRAWPENAAARAGLVDALTAMATYELEHGDARTAAVLIAEVSHPPPELAERIARAESAAADRSHRLERYEADADVERHSVVRTAFLIVCGLVGTALPFTAAAFPAIEVGHGLSIITTACVVAGMLVFGWVARDKMMQTTWNRGVFLVTLFGMVMHGVLEAVCWIAGIDMVLTHMLAVAVWAGVLGVASIYLDRALLMPTLGFLLTIVAIAWRPATHLWAMSASIMLVLVAIIYLYVMQRRGRKIAGLVDVLRPR